ncbi:MAG: hypothetical protein ACOX60_07185 [Massiliimalia sp.]|jgi:hypothetical protein
MNQTNKVNHSANRSLNQLLQQNSRARDYFVGLPDYVQGMLQQHTFEIHSEEDLKSYAQNVLEQY